MIWLSTFAFALALVAVVSAALAWTICVRLTREVDSLRSRTGSDLQTLAQRLDALNASVSSKLHDLERASPTKLAAEVAELSDAVSRVADTHRRFAGKVWATIGSKRRDEDGVDDDDLAAVLALQKAGPTSPN